MSSYRGIIPRYNKKQGLKDLLYRSIESTKVFLPKTGK